MSKLNYLIITVLLVVVFNSCCGSIIRHFQEESNPYESYQLPRNVYGSYLSGRVAHLRKDFNSASNFYVDVLDQEPANKELLSRVYVMLASKERIEEAAKYAEMSIKQGDRNNFTYIIIAVNETKQGKFTESNQTLNKLQGPIYKEFIIPMLSAWNYVGLGDKDKALETISVIKRDPSFRALYYFHAGMINDYFEQTAEAQKNYEVIVNEESMEMSFRTLQVITNFYIRHDQKDKAIALAKKYSDERLFIDMLKNLNQKVEKANPKNTKKIVDNSSVGTSEALFSIAATLRQGASGIDLAHVFICLSIYANPDYDLAKLLLADILESREMYEDANEVYNQIDKNSDAYFSAQVKKSANLIMMKKYPEAEKLLKSLISDYKNNPQLYLDLGDVLRIEDKQDEAIKNYKLAIKNLPRIENQHWVLFYALGISYERNGDWEDAETQLKTALEMSQNHYLVLNYLGYCWLKQGVNIESAFAMIVDAYSQAPQDGNINDSLGWAFYRLGMYDQAITFLEKASELEPANAVIYDHLGDAYWQGGRRIEASYQWKHALTMKEGLEEIDPKAIKEKIKNGMEKATPLQFNSGIILEKINTIQKD